MVKESSHKNLTEVINRLTYLRDNNASLEDREALDIAIKYIKSLKRQEKFKEVKRALNDPKSSKKPEEITSELGYPENEWIPCTLEELLNNISEKDNLEDCIGYFFSKKRLKEFVRVLEDDGMGYGAFNSYAFTGYPSTNEVQIWI